MANTRTPKLPPVNQRAKSAPLPTEDDASQRVVILGDRFAGVPDDADDRSPALDMVLAQLGGVDDARVMVYRQDKGQPMTYVATYQPEDVQGEASLFETIRQEFGGGSYRVHVRNTSGLLANRRIDIAERKAPTDHGIGSAITAMMNSQQENFRQLAALIASRERAADAGGEEAMLARWKTMAEIMRPASGGNDARTFMQALQQGIELGKAMLPPTGAQTEDVLLGALSAFAPVIADAASQRRAAVAPAGGRPLPGPGGSGNTPKVAAPQTQSSPAMPKANDSAADLRRLLGVLLRAAANDSDPEIYAEMVCDQLGDDSVTQLLSQPDPLALLAGFAPEVTPQRAWFKRLLTLIKGLYIDEDDKTALSADGDSIGPRGSDSDVADHAQAD
jgi:hypothetical protein